jgi:serine protease
MKRRRPLSPRASRNKRLSLETLEDRRLLAAVTSNPAALPDVAVDSGQHRAASLIVQFKNGASSPASMAAYAATANLGAEWTLTPGMRRVNLDPTTDWAAALTAFKNDPNVLFAEPDYRVSLNALPDDPDIGNLWGLNNTGQTGGVEDADIDAPEAWDKTTGSRSTVVAVIDTGVDYNHPDLYQNIWINQNEIPASRKANLTDIDGDGLITFADLNDPQNQGPFKITDGNGDGRIDGADLLKPMQKSGGQDTGNGGWADGADSDHNGYVDDFVGYDFVNHDDDPMDDHFHGTHVSGTIGAMGNDGNGIAGVNWQVQIMGLKFLDGTGGGYESDAISALNYAVANGAVVSNNSWGGGGFSAAFQTAIQNAASKGHIFVAAAGNDGWNNDLDPFYPAGYNVDNVISVAATDSSDQLAWFSNYGTKSVDLAAPGVNIYSTFPTHVTPAMQQEGFGPNYGTISGTSMATPHVTGVVALVRSLHPAWSYQQVIDQVLGTVDVVDGAAKTITGGRLNAAAAVGNPAADTAGPRVLSTDPSGIVTGTVNHLRLHFNEAIDPTTISIDDVVSITGPDGPIAAVAVLPVVGNSRQFDVTFAPQTTLGTYTLVLGPNISDLAGNLMDQNRNGTGGEDPGDSFSGTFEISDVVSFDSPDVPQDIDNLNSLFGISTQSTLTIGSNITVSDLNVQLDVSFPYAGDLKIYLESPSGTQVMLSNFNGGEGADFAGTIFDDEADQPISSGFAPFFGSYRPDESLAAFDGQNAAGVWTLFIDADFNIDHFLDGTGVLNAWSLQLSGAGGGDPPPPPPPPPPPGNRPPVAGSDSLSGEVNTRLSILPADLLANDTDPDGDPLSIKFVGNPTHGSVSLDQNQLITFTPDPDYSGIATFEYIVSDGFLTATGEVSIDFEPLFQFHNSNLAADVNNDGVVSPIDALLIINVINSIGSTPLVSLSVGSTPSWYPDVSPDNYVAPIDALMVINYINAHPASSSSSAMSAQAHTTSADNDLALLSLLGGNRDKAGTLM